MDATYTAVNSKRKEGSTNEKRPIQLHSNEIQTIEPIFESKISKVGDSMSPAPSRRGRKKSKRCTNEKRRFISLVAVLPGTVLGLRIHLLNSLVYFAQNGSILSRDVNESPRKTHF